MGIVVPTEHISNSNNSPHPIIQAGGALPVPERLQDCVRVQDALSVATPAADHGQPAAAVGRGEEVWCDVPVPERPRAGK